MVEQSFLPVRDSKIQGTPEFAKSFNYGSAPSLRHVVLYNGGDKTTWERTIVDFDLSALAGKQLVAAKLVREIVNLPSASGPAAKLSRCTRPGAWVESQVSWLNYKAGSAWTDEGGDFDDTGPPGALSYDEPTTTGTHEIGGLLPFVEDALANRGGIVSLITRLADEDPGVDAGAAWQAKGQPNAWQLAVEYGSPDPGRQSVPRSGTKRRGARPYAPATPRRALAPTSPRSPRRRRP